MVAAVAGVEVVADLVDQAVAMVAVALLNLACTAKFVARRDIQHIGVSSGMILPIQVRRNSASSTSRRPRR